MVRRTGLLTCDFLQHLPTEWQWHKLETLVAYSCGAVADFHRLPVHPENSVCVQDRSQKLRYAEPCGAICETGSS
jgi:hypothetical protein